jgi:short-subunit dehydrogenase
MVQEGSVVVVAGASAGVGRATARAFAEEGAKVGLLARGEAGLDAAADEVESAGGEALAVRTDVADADAVEDAADAVESALGPIDVWVNVAMTSVFGEVSDLSPDEIRRVTDVTYGGVVNGTLVALDRMRPRDEGRIVQAGSALAFRGVPLQSAYCASKRAVQGFTEALRSELAHEDSDVSVSIVHFPALNTPQFEWVRNRMPGGQRPFPPIYQPEVAADAILHAVETGRTETWVGLPTVGTALANRLSSRLVDRLLARLPYGLQQTGRPTTDRAGNLYDPTDDDRDYGTHGPFDDRALPVSPLFELTKRRGLLARTLVGILALAVAVRSARSGRGRSGREAETERGTEAK